jgi:hypothetical protein
LNHYKTAMKGIENSGNPNNPQLASIGQKIVPENERLGMLKDMYGEKALKQMGLVECATCASRTYVDGSDDPGVSFKTPTQISPEASFALVSAHEQEHVVNERSDAEAEDREVIAQSVQIFMSICPECGKAYSSGGVTRTTTASKQKYENAGAELLGALLDAKV